MDNFEKIIKNIDFKKKLDELDGLINFVFKYKSDLDRVLDSNSSKSPEDQVRIVSDLLEKLKIKKDIQLASKTFEIDNVLNRVFQDSDKVEIIKKAIIEEPINKVSGTDKTINSVQEDKIRRLVCILLKKKIIEIFQKSPPEKVLLNNLKIDNNIIDKYKNFIKLRIEEIEKKDTNNEYIDMFEQEILSNIDKLKKL